VTSVCRERKVMQCIRHQHSEQHCYWEDGDGGMWVFVCLLHCIKSDKFVLSNESHAMYQTPAQRTELLLRGWRRDSVYVCLLHCIKSGKFVLRNESHEIYQTSAQGTELWLRGWRRGNVSVFRRIFYCNKRFTKICNFLVNFLIKFSLLATNISYIL